MMTFKMNLVFRFLLLAISIMILDSCNKDNEALTPIDCDNFWDNRSVEAQLPPNTLEILGTDQVFDEALNADCISTTISATSHPHESMLLPNAANAGSLPPGMITTLEGSVSASYPDLLANTGGYCRLTINRGVYSETIEVPRRTPEILSAITELQNNIPPGYGQSIEITVHEVYSLQDLFAKIGFSGNGPFYDFASQLDYSSYDYNHKYVVTAVVHDFSVKIEHPSSDPCILLEKWAPNATPSELASLRDIPVYVEQTHYGKSLMMTVETNHSGLEVKAMLEGSFGGVLGGGEVNLDAGYNQLRSESNLSIQAIGGSLDWIIRDIQTDSESPMLGWLQDVVQDKTGKTAAPLFVQMAFLHDGSNANVVLATDEYVVRECTALPHEFEKSIDLNAFRVNDPCNSSPALHNPFEFICPIHVGGDRDFGGECDQTMRVELVRKNNNKELWVHTYFQVIEPNPDYTEGEVYLEELVYSAPSGYYIASINSDHSSKVEGFYDDDHSLEIHNLPSGELVNKFTVNGDNNGKDIRSNSQGECNCEQDPKAYLTIDFNAVSITVKEL